MGVTKAAAVCIKKRIANLWEWSGHGQRSVKGQAGNCNRGKSLNPSVVGLKED